MSMSNSKSSSEINTKDRKKEKKSVKTIKDNDDSKTLKETKVANITMEFINYDKEFLLDRAYNSFSLDKKRMSFAQPEFETKDRKSYIHNFKKLCQSLNRDPEEIRTYIGKELQMDTSIKENGALKIDAIVKPANRIEGILRDFIKDNVMCQSCKSCKTITKKIDRLTYMICDVCKSKRAISK
jgi:translation initiation factor 2 beta subunit (eIF-2beta)/eIF-5